MAKSPTEQSAMQRLKELEEERSSLLESVKAEALDRANESIAALNALGFSYQLVQNGAGGGRGRSKAGEGSRQGTRQVNAERPCPICQFRTEPPHDARKHRSQAPKRPFTAEELEANHLRRI